ncbi:major capsid protein P2 [Pseudoalteromonas sp. MM17-2]|uniref:major capsid protein P2 n=1 Tax=Pseudoalteromonas sp. MM17-2 TaxID=2917753 RepID=UPI001EF5EC8D|nr:major capsid protein P2 [Pseudoalteromonas sp. MM17-2]MCG7544084.1 major capsid protein P2 [Pseudoalteromonas sp. MM17-2]
MQLQRFNPLWRKMRSAEGVAAGQVGHIEIVGGSTIHEIELATNITNPAHLKKVTLEIDGVAVVSYTGQWLKDKETYANRFKQPGRYKIRFSDLTYRSREGVRSGELVTFSHEQIFLKIEVDSAFVDAEGAPKPVTINGRTAVTAGQAVRHFMPRVYETTFDASASGINDLIWKNGGPNRKIRRIHFRTADLGKINIYRDARLIHEETKADADFDIKENGLMPIEGVYTFDPTKQGFGWDGLFGTHGQELKFELDMANAGSVRMLVEMMEQVAPLNAQAA